LIANADLIALLRRCQAPYPVPTPCAAMAEQALSAPVLEVTARRIAQVRGERERMYRALVQLAGVRRVYPSQGNFLLVRLDDAQAAFQALLEAGIVVRDQRAVPRLADALRITLGTHEQNERVLSVLQRTLEASA